MKDYYKILNIEQNADIYTIKKQYRILSLKHHPDRGGDAESFKEINEAYEILSDSESKYKYDNENKLRFDKENSTNLEENFFNMFFNGQQNNINLHNILQQINKPVPIVTNITITLEQSFTGVYYPIEIEKFIINCFSEQKNYEKETLYLNIPEGIDNGEIITIHEKGNIVGKTSGDIKIVITIENKTSFIRNGLDLLYKKEITLKEAICGFYFEIIHLNGKKLNFDNTKNHTIIKPGFKRCINNLGLKR
jgi:DnaJ family protein A protein 2